MKSWRFDGGFIGRLFERLNRQHRVLSPEIGKDGVCRLQPVGRLDPLPVVALPLIPFKKVLLPPREVLWTGDDEHCQSPTPEPASALVGILPCDLYALDYLDKVFFDDPLYRQRRVRLLVVGMNCIPGPDCFCPRRSQPPPFDLFLGAYRVWAGSAAGEVLLAELSGSAKIDENVPLPASVTAGTGGPRPKNIERLFLDSSGWPLWQEVAGRCVSCGACSAVCPTCYCYDVVDEALLDGCVIRRREWDNCFFRNHALVAGGQNFRPGRRERLRFRFEHKLLGFGALRGVDSCVGCGRCKAACPVDIDISEVLGACRTWE